MLRLLAKVLTLGILVILVKIGLLLATSRYENDYMGASRIKQARLKGPGVNRIIFIGGSNLAFGIDSDGLEACIGRRVVNMGLQASLGLEYMFDEAAAGARAGDVAVIVPEYEHFCGGDPAGDGQILLWLLQFNPSAAQYFRDGRQWFNVLRAAAVINNRLWVHTMLMRVARQEVLASGELYSAGGFNSKGDFVAHLGRTSAAVLTASELGAFDPRALRLVDQFCDQMAARSVRCLLVYPAVSQSYWNRNRATIIRVADALSSRHAVTRPEEWVYPDQYFFDTSYHLNGIGRQARKEKLCDVLSSALAHGN